MNIKVNFNKIIGRIKPLHGVGQPPFAGADFSMCALLKKAGIPYSRLHDVGGAYGGFRWVDIPNIFRDFVKNPKRKQPRARSIRIADKIYREAHRQHH